MRVFDLLKQDECSIKGKITDVNFSSNDRITEISKSNLLEGKKVIRTSDDIVGEINFDTMRYLNKNNDYLLYESIVDTMQESVIAIDKDGIIFYVNKSYINLIGVHPRKLIGKNIQNVEVNSKIYQALKQKRNIVEKNSYVKSVDKFVDLNVFLMKKDEEVIGSFSVFTDVTELHHLNKKYHNIKHRFREYSNLLEISDKIDKLGIIGNDILFLRMLSKVAIASKSDASVLILGENGTGKDLIASLIHSTGPRSDKPYVTLNCAAIPENLFESEMFGYEKGAFTGAKQEGKRGKFELADKGTIFLDEIGDMALETQAKLLRVLDKGEIEKVGSERKQKVDVRIISATNQDLEKKIQEKKFRNDLFFRLGVITIEVPPLRNRGNDVLLIAQSFLDEFNQKYNKSLIFDENVKKKMLAYDWPGNIRELRNCVENCVIFSKSTREIQIDDLPARMKDIKNINTSYGLKKLLDEREKEIISQYLSFTDGNYINTAQLLNISERTLYRKMQKYNIIY